MNKTESLIRIAILLILATVGFGLVIGEEQDENLWSFFFHVIFDKAMGVGCLYLMSKLYSRWCKTDKWIARFEAWNAKGLEE